MNVFYMAPDRDDAREFIELCAEWSARHPDIISPTEYRICFESGFTIYAMPTKLGRLRGKQGYAIFDNAWTQDNAALLQAASGLLIWGGRVAIIEPNALLVQAIKRGEQKASLHEVFIHDALADGLYRRICELRQVEWSEDAEAEWLSHLRLSVGDAAFAVEFEGKQPTTP